MPQIEPETPEYPYQHICSDYFQIHGKEYCVVVDRFSGWFNTFQAKDGTHGLVKTFTRLFQDMGVPETLTTDGGTTYVSQVFEEFLSSYRVHHRVSGSVLFKDFGFWHGVFVTDTVEIVNVETEVTTLPYMTHCKMDIQPAGIEWLQIRYR